VDQSGIRCRIELGDRGHPEFAIECLHAFRPESGHFKQFGDGRRYLLAQFIEQRTVSGGYDFVNSGSKIGADAGQLGQRGAGVDEGLEFAPEAADGARRIAVGPNPERIVATDFQQIGNLIEYCRDVGVVHWHVDRSLCGLYRFQNLWAQFQTAASSVAIFDVRQ